MDQERALHQLNNNLKVTGETILKFMWQGYKETAYFTQSINDEKSFVGELEWNKFMASGGEKQIKTFMTSEINLDLLKKELQEYGLGFTFFTNKDGTTSIAYEAKNEAILVHAWENVIKDLTTNPDEFTKRLVKTPENMNISEKIKYYKEAAVSGTKEVTNKVSKAVVGTLKGKEK
ncbi:TPA: hypothetical protein ACGO5G_000454 [Streptococcus suis]